jgi:hypothetical protein
MFEIVMAFIVGIFTLPFLWMMAMIYIYTQKNIKDFKQWQKTKEANDG